jgi:RNA polymerase sigma factor (sigma-70 family)
MDCWDDIESVPDRDAMLLALLGAIVSSSMVPISERDLIEAGSRLLADSWADFERSELRRVVHGDVEIPGTTTTVTGFLVSSSPPTEIGTVFARSAESEVAALAVAEIEGPQGGAGGPPQSLFAARLLTVEGEQQLGIKAIQGDRDARNGLILSNTRLAALLARKSRTSASLDVDDLFQEATLGLLRAAEKFDPSLGFKFSTYATWWVRQAVARAAADKSRTVRIPVHVVEKVNQIAAIERRHRKEGRLTIPSDGQIAAETGWSPSEVAQYRQAEILPMQLDSDFDIEDRAVPSVEDQAIAFIEILELKDMLKTHLSEREIDVLTRRLGLFGRPQETLDAIGVRYVLTRERIRQIENHALKKLHDSHLAVARRAPASQVSVSPPATEMLEHPANARARRQAGSGETGRSHPKASDSAASALKTSDADTGKLEAVVRSQVSAFDLPDTPLQRWLDRLAAEHATMLLCDPETGRPTVLLGRRDIEMLREAMARAGDQSRAQPDLTEGAMSSLREVARGQTEMAPGQHEVLDSIAESVRAVAATHNHRSQAARIFEPRSIAAMLYGMTVVAERA